MKELIERLMNERSYRDPADDVHLYFPNTYTFDIDKNGKASGEVVVLVDRRKGTAKVELEIDGKELKDLAGQLKKKYNLSLNDVKLGGVFYIYSTNAPPNIRKADIDGEVTVSVFSKGKRLDLEKYSGILKFNGTLGEE